MSNDKRMNDEKWRYMFKHGAPSAPPSPWFTKNVLHRLPERKRRIAMMIEYALYVAGVIATSINIYKCVGHALASGAITVGDIMTFGALMALLLSLIYMIVAPLASRRDEVI